MKTLFIVLQHLLPQHLLSRLVGWLAECTWSWLKNPLIALFIRHYKVNMSEAVHSQPEDFRHFNDFFTRELKPDARTIDQQAGSISSPADGAVSQLGKIENGRIFQAKGQDYSLVELLGGNRDHAERFMEGEFATIYLSPRDYHRVHMPLDGTLTEMTYIPGDLYSVNQATAEGVPRLFARNERLVCLFETEAGPMAMILVGAMIVAGIETVWSGQVTPQRRRVVTTDYREPPAPITLRKGEEMGRFKLGSTVVLLFGKEAAEWQSHLGANTPLVLGERIGHLTPNDQ